MPTAYQGLDVPNLTDLRARGKNKTRTPGLVLDAGTGQAVGAACGLQQAVWGACVPEIDITPACVAGLSVCDAGSWWRLS